jgi:superfamily II DNA or RNA helicase
LASLNQIAMLGWWRGQGYVASELGNVYTGHHARAGLILQAVQDKAEPQTMQAIGFCVSIDHAEFMARFFADHGVRARAVTSRDSVERLREVMAQLKSGALRILFTVDLFQ